METIREIKRNNVRKNEATVQIVKRGEQKEEEQEQFYDNVMNIIVVIFWMLAIYCAFIIVL